MFLYFVVPVYVVRSTTEPQSVSCDRRKRRQHTHWSEVTNCPRIKKSDDQRASSLLLTLKRPILVVGDVIVEFYNKPKMMKKVLSCWGLCFCWLSLCFWVFALTACKSVYHSSNCINVDSQFTQTNQFFYCFLHCSFLMHLELQCIVM